MKFSKYFVRCSLLAVGTLAFFPIAWAVGSNVPRDRARLATLRAANAIIKQHQALYGRLPSSVKMTVDGAKGHSKEVKLPVGGWCPVDWAANEFRNVGGPFDESASDYLISYTTPNAEWTDILDSKTGKTTVGASESPLAYLNLGGAVLIGSVCLFAARRLRQ